MWPQVTSRCLSCMFFTKRLGIGHELAEEAYSKSLPVIKSCIPHTKFGSLQACKGNNQNLCYAHAIFYGL